MNGPGGGQLLDQVESVFRRYTVQPNDHAYAALAVYTAYTHAADCFDFAPRLLLTSAEKRSGKTRTMEIVGAMAWEPLYDVNATVPALFRSLNEPRTVLFDEVDTIFGTKVKAEQNEDLRGLINAGFERGSPVLRVVGPTHTPTEFPCFAPMVLCAIGQLPDTIADRAVNIRLRRRKTTETCQPYRKSKDEPALRALGQQINNWITANLDTLKNATTQTPLTDRQADLWEPLLAVADLAGGKWPNLIRTAAVELGGEQETDEPSIGLELLGDIRQALKVVQSKGMVETYILIERLKAIPESRWTDAEYGLTPRKLSALLKPYGVRPERTNQARGYSVAKLQDVIERYLDPEPSQDHVTSVTSVRNSDLPAETPVTEKGTVTDRSVTDTRTVTHITAGQRGKMTRVTDVTQQRPELLEVVSA